MPELTGTALKSIRDPVYDYVHLTSIEQSVVDLPAFQRLRFILQNSSSHTTYPSNVGTRFAHSLGAAHLGGRILVASLEHARGDVLKDFLGQVMRLMESLFGSHLDLKVVQESWVKDVGDICRFSHSPFRGDRTVVGETELFTINVLWQAVRLSSLIHDLGHLPQSHVFESAIDAVVEWEPDEIAEDSKSFQSEISKRFEGLIEKIRIHLDVAVNPATLQTHECFSLKWFYELYPTEGGATSAVPSIDYQRLVFLMAKLIFLLNTKVKSLRTGSGAGGGDPDRFGPLRCLHSIVSGDLDADRLDYCVRDPKTSGLELGAIDVQRIVDAMTLTKDTDGRFAALPTAKALSAIESFFHQRYLMYRYLIYHHNTVRMDALVREIIVALIHIGLETTRDNQIAEILESAGFWRREPGKNHPSRFMGRHDFSGYDDGWLRTIMHQVCRNLAKRERAEEQLSADLSRLLLFLNTYLGRKTANLFSCWKRDCDFMARLGKALPDDAAAGKIVGMIKKLNNKSLLRRDLILYKVIKPLEDELRGDGVYILFRPLGPKIVDRAAGGARRSRAQALLNERIVPLSVLSPYLRSLEDISKCTPNIHVSFIKEGIKDDPALYSKCGDRFFERLAEYLETVPDEPEFEPTHGG